jgi:hypothetical protein
VDAWTRADFSTAARHVGETQGAFASGIVALPVEEWLSRRWLRGWVDACAPLIEELRGSNLFTGGDGTTVAIDWSQVGIGAVAQDLDQMTLDTVWMPVRPDESAHYP